MLSRGAMRVYENSSSCKRQQHVDPWTTCCRALRQDSSQLKMEWLVDQKLILYQASWCAVSDLVWTRWHQIWQGLDTVNCEVAKCELHWDILPGMQVGDCRFCLLLCKPEYRLRIAYNSVQTDGWRLTVVKCKVQKEEFAICCDASQMDGRTDGAYLGGGRCVGRVHSVVMRPSSLRRGPHIASHSVCLSVCPSVPCVPFWSVTWRHLANYNDTLRAA